MTGPSRTPPPSGLPPHLDPRGPRPAGGSHRLGAPHPPGGSSRVGRPPHRHRHRFGRALSWIAVGLSVVLFASAALGYVLYRRYDGNITRIPGLNRALPGLVKPAAAPHDAKNILLVGSDSRASTGSQFQGTGANYTSGQRSDTMIIAHLYGSSNQAQLVSLPRDSWVPIPAYTDPATGKVTAEHSAKLNSAIDEGGPALLIATIEQLTNIRIDNYVQIDFAGFQTMVAALGGVNVCLNHAAKDSFSGINLPAGPQVINGAQALAFVRQRHGLPNGDIDRIRRQQSFIGSIARKVLSSGTLLDPFKLNSFLDAATKSVTVDDKLSTAGLTSLALRLKGVSAGGVLFSTLPYTTISAVREGQDVVLLDPVKDAALFTSLRDDRVPGAATPTPTPSAGAPLTVAPGAVRVSVLNGAGVSGLGRQASLDLSRAGFVVVGGAGNSGTGATTTVIRYGPTRAEAARTLAAAVPGSSLEPDASLGSTVELVAGSSFTGVQPVTVGSTATAAPAPVPTTSAAPVSTAAQAGCID